MFKIKKPYLFLIVIISTLIISCTQQSSNQAEPRRVLADYVQRGLAVKTLADKSQLLTLTTGEARKMLENLNEEEFKKNFIESHREFVSLKVKDERPVTPEKYSITYELIYKIKSPNSDDLVTLKKHALFTYLEGHWLITEVQNLKTLVEHQNAMSF